MDFDFSQMECMVEQLESCSDEELQNMMNITHEDLTSQVNLVCGTGGCDLVGLQECQQGVGAPTCR